MKAISAGLLLYRRRPTGIECLLVHPGGPFWARKDEGAWSIPKGLMDAGEDAVAAARREFAEEVGAVPDGPLVPLGEFRLSGSKQLLAFALEADFDPAQLASNTFEMEWPPRSGRSQSFPEVDRAAWFDLDTARAKLTMGQKPVVEALRALVG